MCGIAGLLRLNGEALAQAAADAVKSMTDKMVYRGPDGEGLWLSGPVCLGHRRLSIIDIAGGAQPMTGPSGHTHIVYNGEIYNYRELKIELEKRGTRFKTSCDTETLLAAYETWGEDCVNRFDGMFAFAIWDDRERKLFCARDPFGKKPFYYSCQNGFFAFASELGALAAIKSPNFSFRLNPRAIMRYLAYEYAPTPQSVYAEAEVLEPAHTLTIDKNGARAKRYWDLPEPAEKMEAPEPELAERLRELMKEAVNLRMISDVPLGVFLSGGIDSTIVAGLMAELSPTPIKSFSIGFKEASYDESRYARIAARAYGTDHYEKILSAEDCARELPGIVGAMDTPMADASCAPTWLLSALARERVTVALGGDGADELWAGYEHYPGYRMALAYNKLPVWIREKVIAPLVRFLPASSGYVNLRLAVATFLQGAAAPNWLRVQTMLTAIPPETQAKILSAEWLNIYARPDDFLNPDNLFAPTRAQYDFWKDAAPLARAFRVYARQYMLDDILVKVDRCSMLHSLEARSPFLDRRVAEFVCRLPVNCKLRGFKRKYLLKKAFANLLPPRILKRNKRGFQIPVAAWLRGRLKPLLLELMAPERLKKQGIFNTTAVGAMMEAHFSGEKDLRKPLWTLLVLQIWIEANKPDF